MIAKPTQGHDFHILVHVGVPCFGFSRGLREVIFVHWSPAKLSRPRWPLLSLQCGAFSRDVILDLNYWPCACQFYYSESYDLAHVEFYVCPGAQ